MSLPPAYSVLCGAERPASTGYTLLGTPPLGYKWLVTDVVFYCPPYSGSGVFFLADSATGLAWAGLPIPNSLQATWFVQERNFVCEGYSSIDVYTDLIGVEVMVSGKQLSIV